MATRDRDTTAGGRRGGARPAAPRTAWAHHRRRLGALVATAAATLACASPDDEVDPDAIVVGAALPFTGEGATIGQNLEQALLLAVEDVNRAGGVNGRRLRLASRDSNSGTARGLDSVLELLYLDEVRYLVGPEENELASEIIPDLKGLDVFEILPGYASPSVQREETRGRRLRLPPSPLAFGCGLSELARQLGVEAANSISAQDDFSQSVASEFSTEFNGIDGKVLPSITVRAGASSYAERIEPVLARSADRTLLIVNPTTASTLLTEWAVSDGEGAWLLGPMLHTPGFLQNLPFSSLENTFVLSPTLSLASECDEKPIDFRGRISCRRDNADAFGDYYARRWEGNRPFPAAHFYYDAVILLAMGLERVAADGNDEPTSSELHDAILEMSATAAERIGWRELPAAMDALRDGEAIAYAGAAAEYDFDQFGAAKHLVFDTWRVRRQNYNSDGLLQARCLRQPK